MTKAQHVYNQHGVHRNVPDWVEFLDKYSEKSSTPEFSEQDARRCQQKRSGRNQTNSKWCRSKAEAHSPFGSKLFTVAVASCRVKMEMTPKSIEKAVP